MLQPVSLYDRDSETWQGEDNDNHKGKIMATTTMVEWGQQEMVGDTQGAMMRGG